MGEGGLTCRKSCSTGVTHTSSGCTQVLHPAGMKTMLVPREPRRLLNSAFRCPRWMSAISRREEPPPADVWGPQTCTGGHSRISWLSPGVEGLGGDTHLVDPDVLAVLLREALGPSLQQDVVGEAVGDAAGCSSEEQQRRQQGAVGQRRQDHTEGPRVGGGARQLQRPRLLAL